MSHQSSEDDSEDDTRKRRRRLVINWQEKVRRIRHERSSKVMISKYFSQFGKRVYTAERCQKH